MFNFPETIKNLFTILEIPSDFRKQKNHPLINILVTATKDYRELIAEIDNPRVWEQLKKLISQKVVDTKIDEYIRFYEVPTQVFNSLNEQLISLNIRELIYEFLVENGYADIANQKTHEVDKDRLKSVVDLMLNKMIVLFQNWDSMDYEESLIEATTFLENQSNSNKEKIALAYRLISSHMLITFYNAISIMTSRQSIFALVRKAISGQHDSDEAMCLAVRIDNNLHNHPAFLERYKRATIESDQIFLNKFNDTSSPITHKTKYMGVYFLISMLHSFGILDKFKNTQILDLCDLAGLYKYESRIEDAKYVSRIKNEFLMLNLDDMSTN